ncbi:MAG: MMPL family transporter, partial [Clostridia bacterium]|nr:MMPL family transporter [Clostridia bacterium]
MKRAARWIVRHRLPLTAVLLALSAVCGLLSFQVPINADMTKYLPADSAMKQGMDVMEREFGSLSLPPTLRVMIENLPAEEEAGALETLRDFPAAAAAVLSGRKREEGTSYTLFTVTLSAPYRTPEALETEHGIPGAFPGRRTTVRNDDANGMEIPLFIYAVAGAMLLAVLFTFCASWAEPFVFLAVLGTAILMNMGTNLLLGSVSVTTHSISAILQLVLSMDYSIILINRFRREYGTERDAEEAMARALAGAFPSIASSGMTTVVGLLMLVFMRFRIGADLGLVLAKGVFLSMVCCLTLLPAGILFGRRAIERTKKPSIHIPTRA